MRPHYPINNEPSLTMNPKFPPWTQKLKVAKHPKTIKNLVLLTKSKNIRPPPNGSSNLSRPSPFAGRPIWLAPVNNDASLRIPAPSQKYQLSTYSLLVQCKSIILRSSMHMQKWHLYLVLVLMQWYVFGIKSYYNFNFWYTFYSQCLFSVMYIHFSMNFEFDKICT